MAVVPDVGFSSDFAVADSGAVYVVGRRGTFFTDDELQIARLNEDGSVDTTFGVDGVTNAGFAIVEDMNVHAVAAVGDGGVIIALETRETVPGPYQDLLIRVDANGSLVSSFGSGGVFVADPATCDGAAPAFSSERVDLLVAPDGTFGYRQDDVCVAGFGGRRDSAIARLDANGQLISSFADDGWRVDTTRTRLVGIDDNGRALVTADDEVRRLRTDGVVDPSFTSVDVGFGEPGLNPSTGGIQVVRLTGGNPEPPPGGEYAPPTSIELYFYAPDGQLDPDRPPLLLGAVEDFFECPFEWETFIFTDSGAAYVRPNYSFGCLAHVHLVGRDGQKVENWGDNGFGDFTGQPQGQLFDIAATSAVSDDQYALVLSNPLQVLRFAADVQPSPDPYPDAAPGREQNPGPGSPIVEAGDPVNTATGALVEQVVDLTAPVGAPNLTWVRSYNSQRDTTTSLGLGWTTSWDGRLDIDASGATYRNEHGAEYRYELDTNGTYQRPDGLLADLVATPTGTELRWFDGDVMRFDPAGFLAERADWTGQSVLADRTSDGVLQSLTASNGSTLALSYVTVSDGSSRLASVVASDGRRVDYTYDDTNTAVPGLLASVTNPHGAMTFGHDASGRVTSATDGEGTVVHVTEYGPDDRVVSQTLATGEVTTFDFDEQTRTMIVSDLTSGDVVQYHYATDARLISITDPAGSVVGTAWNADDQLTSSNDRLGHAPSASYDEFGNLTSTTDPVRGTTSYVYDAVHRVTSVTEPTGAITTMTYEGSERLPSSVTDGLGHTTTFDIVDGLVQSVTDPDGVITTYGYDAQRRMVSMTNGLGDTWTYTHDAVGRQVSETTPVGHVTSETFDDAGRVSTSTAADGGTTTYTYDSEGRVVSVTDPVGAVTANTYDPVTGLLVSTTDPAGRVTSYVYNALGELTSVTNNDGAVSETDYGTLGRVTASRDALGREMTYAYDANGNRAEVAAPDGGVTRTEYDTAGRITALEDPLGRRTSHTYDQFGRLVTVTQPDGTTMSYSYDLLGRRETVTAPDGGVTTTGFTRAGRTDTVTDPEGGVTGYAYDLAGRLSAVTDPNGHTTTVGYDADGRRTAVTTPEGLVTSWEYDPVGRITTIIDPAGVSMTRTYTLRGEVASEHRSGDGEVSYSYNLDGTLASVTDAVGNVTSMTYDAAGRRATRVDASGAIESWTYNPAGELIAQTDRMGNQTTIGYDPAGRIQSVVDASGRSTNHTYNTGGELLERSFGDGTTIAYTYDQTGRRASMTDPTGTTTYTYDPNGRPTEVAAPGGTLGYGYDLAGRRTSLTYPDGATAAYTYDPAGRLTSVAEASVDTIDYTLDNDGRLTQTSLPNGQTRDFSYTNGQLTSHVDQGRSTTLTYDDSGRIGALSGADNHTYTYDPAGQLLEAAQDNGTFAYTYGPHGEITSITDPDRTRTFDHNANVEITTITDNAGEAANAIHDPAGRMVEHVDPNGTITSYNYDARGLLVEVVLTEPADTTADDDPCAELTPTIVGTDGDDIIQSGNGVDIIFAGDGNDIIDGGNGADIICAGAGDDTIIGGNGADVIDAGPGNDHVDAGHGADTVTGGPGTDTIIGDKGDDTLSGGNGNDTINGGQGNDTCEDDNTTQCEELTPTAEPPAPSVTIESRTYDGDGTLNQVDIIQPDGTTTTDELLWDPTMAIPQIVSWSDGTGADDLLYGYHREALGGAWESYNGLGDSLAAGGEWSPFGRTSDLSDLELGYRAELETTSSVHLRARDLLASVARFATTDPLVGVVGRPTYLNAYHYADNDPVNLVDPLGLRPTDAQLGPSIDLGTSPTSAPFGFRAPGAGGSGLVTAQQSIDPSAGCSGDPVERVLCAADNLIAMGSAGRDYRDNRNERVTNVALNAVWLANGACHEQASGLIVCVVDDGIDLAIDDIARILAGPDDAISTPFGDISIPDVDLPISARGGTTYGNVFVTTDRRDLSNANLLSHELIHAYQWAAAGDINYAQLYVRESLSSLRQGTSVAYKRGIKWVRRWGVRVPVPYVYPSVRLGDPGCLNRFEIHADLVDGEYDHC